ncbi:copper amine oxidase N-terminal domain-containing protein [Schinkia sp. CFF1]
MGSKYPLVNGEKTVINVPAKILNRRTLVPLRFVSEALGANVSWDEETRIITIQSSEKSGFNVVKIY